MKWLTEERTESSNSSSPYLTRNSSMTSLDSNENGDVMDSKDSVSEKCLSTILRLDREHNMFGLSNIAIVGKDFPKKKHKKDNDDPVFPQTAIIEICIARRCCKHKSNTDLPASLKCNACQSCCGNPCCSLCSRKCGFLCEDRGLCSLPCSTPPSQCPRGTCICKISFKRKTTFDLSPNELTPRSSCILQKPMAARSCHHLPQCVPPSSCFPYLMPCYWPARAGAPCNNPSQCFHNPPCRPPRRRKSYIPPEETCPKTVKCESREEKCTNQACPGQSSVMKSAIESRFGSKK
ncbi:keratin-associated protein 9-1-like isoform X2 [Bicyclus anynana]|uniref:Keratin-associated protein 9-1-like isoform X2 n=1 Tax=Bicyclus anynana TaxID=110368 RepID=A0ABM3M369_BICAN|nr:keratin-associated protein 9-1-like isoform X2 [Bicyclus anynana]